MRRALFRRVILTFRYQVFFGYMFLLTWQSVDFHGFYEIFTFNSRYCLCLKEINAFGSVEK